MSHWRESINSWGGIPVAVAFVAIVGFIVAVIMFSISGANEESYKAKIYENAEGRVLGISGAPVRIIEFGDLQCSHCKTFHDDIAPKIIEDFISSGIATLEFRHLAFLGPESILAATAAECALEQEHYWDYIDLLFFKQNPNSKSTFSTTNLKKYARELENHYPNFDVMQFDSCLNSLEKRELVINMSEDALRLGFSSTPTFLINGIPFSNSGQYETFRTAIESAAKK
tara:strand:+ start:5511 stop:6194 length:684 start_codon:yes stop_codon:yes gene_type:complete